MDNVSSVVTQMGALVDDTLDMFVKTQTECPINFKELTDVLREDAVGRPDYHVFFLSAALATAIIRLAALDAAGRSES